MSMAMIKSVGDQHIIARACVANSEMINRELNPNEKGKDQDFVNPIGAPFQRPVTLTRSLTPDVPEKGKKTAAKARELFFKGTFDRNSFCNFSA